MIATHHKNITSKGFTLLELTVAMVVGLMIATITLTLFNQQLAYFEILKDQRFMIQEAPQINSVLNSLISRANKMNVDKDKKILTLIYLNPETNNTTSATIIFNNGTLTYQNAGGSSWNITTQLHPDDGIEYDPKDDILDTGVLTIKLTGPKGGEIYYSTTPL